MNTAAVDLFWYQAVGVGPNGRYHRRKVLDWGGEQKDAAVCGGYALIELDLSRPLNRHNPDARKCKACLNILRVGNMGYGDGEQLTAPAIEALPTKWQGGKRAALALQAERHRRQAEYAERRLAELEALPEEPIVEDGEPNVIWFTKVFQNGSREYTYAACKAGDGLWYTTGPNTPKGYSWEALVEWMYDGSSCNAWHAVGYDELQ